MVAKRVSEATVEHWFQHGSCPGCTVSRLSGDVSGLKNHRQEALAAKPFSLIPLSEVGSADS